MKNDQIPRRPPVMRAATAPACPGWTPIGTLPPVVAPPTLAPLSGRLSKPIGESASEPAPPLPADPIVGRR